METTDSRVLIGGVVVVAIGTIQVLGVLINLRGYRRSPLGRFLWRSTVPMSRRVGVSIGMAFLSLGLASVSQARGVGAERWLGGLFLLLLVPIAAFAAADSRRYRAANPRAFERARAEKSETQSRFFGAWWAWAIGCTGAVLSPWLSTLSPGLGFGARMAFGAVVGYWACRKISVSAFGREFVMPERGGDNFGLRWTDYLLFVVWFGIFMAVALVDEWGAWLIAQFR